MSLILEAVIIFAAILLPALLGVLVARRYLPPSFHVSSSKSAEAIWAIVGVTFGLLLGFLVVNLWGDLQNAQATVQDEANDISAIHHLTYGLPESAMPAELRGRIREYARLLVDEEWPVLGRHESSSQADAALEGLWRSYLALEAPLGGTNTSYNESIVRLLDLEDARNRRIDSARSVVPVALWAVLIGGVVLMIGTVWLTGPDHLPTHVLMTVVLALSLASILFLIRAFNNPFQGDVRVDPEPIERVLQQIER